MDMRRKILAIGTACMMAAAVLTNHNFVKASAQEVIQNRGSMEWKDSGGPAVNSSDISYLQGELRTLFDEFRGFGSDSADLPIEYDRRKSITSKGVIEFADDTVVFDTSNLIYLADEIDRLECIGKYATLKALNQIGTYYTSSEGDIGHDPDDSKIFPEAASALSFYDLCRGILQSQSVDYLASVQAKNPEENLLYYADENARDSKDLLRVTADANDFPLLIGAAEAGNLSAGTAAWVDGKPVVGTGADNRAYYENGYGEGYEKGYGGGYEEGYGKGRQEGYEEGYGEGHQEGYEEGHKEGYEAGYDSGKKDAMPKESITVTATLRNDYSNNASACEIPIIGAKSVTVIMSQNNYAVANGSYASINGITLKPSKTEKEVTKTWTEEEIGDARYLKCQSVDTVNDRDMQTMFTVTINY